MLFSLVDPKVTEFNNDGQEPENRLKLQGDKNKIPSN